MIDISELPNSFYACIIFCNALRFGSTNPTFVSIENDPTKVFSKFKAKLKVQVFSGFGNAALRLKEKRQITFDKICNAICYL